MTTENTNLQNEEKEQAQRLETIRVFLQTVIFKYLWFLLLVFVASLTAIGYLVYKQIQKDPERYSASTCLLYYPKRTQKIGAFEAKQVMQILSQRSLFLHLSEDIKLIAPNSGSVFQHLNLTQDPRQDSRFLVTASSVNRDEAIAMANQFAKLCIDEYVKHRIAELHKWDDTLLARKAELTESIHQTEEEEARISREIGIVAPEQEAERLQKAIANQHNQLSALNVDIANQKTIKAKRENALKALSPEIGNVFDQLKLYQQELKKLQDDIIERQQLYTDRNPKMMVLQVQYDHKRQEYEAFLKKHNLPEDTNFSVVGSTERANEAILQAEIKLAGLIETQQALQRELKQNEDTIVKLSQVTPQLDQLKNQRISLQGAIKDLEAEASDLKYLMNTAKNDVMQLEEVDFATEKPMLDKKTLVMGIMVTTAIVVVLALFFILCEYLFGKIHSVNELESYHELNFLGSFDHRDGQSKENKTALDSLFYTFKQANLPTKMVFVGYLPGIAQADRDLLSDSLTWNCAMAGDRILNISIVQSDSFNEESIKLDEKLMLAGVLFDGTNGYFPVDNPNALSASELRMLSEDAQILQKEFDIIMLSTTRPLKRSGMFFQQMLELCRCAMIVARMRKSPRNLVRFMASRQRKNNYPVMSVMVI